MSIHKKANTITNLFNTHIFPKETRFLLNPTSKNANGQISPEPGNIVLR